MNVLSARCGRSHLVRWGLAAYLFLWTGGLQGLLLVTLVADNAHSATLTASSTQLRLVLHHHGAQHEHEPEQAPTGVRHDHAPHSAWSETAGSLLPDHELLLGNDGPHSRTMGASGIVPIAKAVAVVSLTTTVESISARLPADQADSQQFALSKALRSHRATVLLI